MEPLQFGVRCTETPGAGPTTVHRQFGVRCTDTLGAVPTTANVPVPDYSGVPDVLGVHNTGNVVEGEDSVAFGEE